MNAHHRAGTCFSQACIRKSAAIAQCILTHVLFDVKGNMQVLEDHKSIVPEAVPEAELCRALDELELRDRSREKHR